MENSFQIKLHCTVSDPNAIYSLLGMMLEKMKFLHGINDTVQLMELRLFDDATMLDANGQADKIAFFRMSHEGGNIMEYSRSKRWDDALLNTIEKIRDRCLKPNPWEKTS